jgi:hypothetical protein
MGADWLACRQGQPVQVQVPVCLDGWEAAGTGRTGAQSTSEPGLLQRMS